MANVIINDTNLTNIADAIRVKNGLTDTYKPSEMAAAILAIEAGSGGIELPNPVPLTDGRINYANSKHWLISQLPAGTVINNGTGTNYGFSDNSQLSGDLSYLTILLTTNGSTNTTATHHYYFYKNTNLTKLPKLIFTNSITSNNCSYFFQYCSQLTEIDEDIFMKKTLSNDGEYISTGVLCFGDVRLYSVFDGCYKIRKHPILDDGTQRTGVNSQTYNKMFSNCYSLDEITNIPVASRAFTANQFTDTFDCTCHVDKITFATQAGGTPYSATWSNQTISLNLDVGNCSIIGRNSFMNSTGFTESGYRVTNANEYATNTAAHPDDWWSSAVEYSRYNHDSAVETINSLPDCSAGSGNVIQFRGSSGSGYGKAISSLTEEEIAVATAKGWTVSLV